MATIAPRPVRPIDSTRDNSVSVRNTDILVLPRRPHTLSADHVPTVPAEAVPLERPDASVTLTIGDVTFDVPQTYAAAFAVVRDLFILDGRAAVTSLESSDDVFDVVLAVGVGAEDADVEPEDVDADADPAQAMQWLFRMAIDELDRRRDVAIERLEPLIAERAAARLADARAQVVVEFNRYFGTGQPVKFQTAMSTPDSLLRLALENRVTVTGSRVPALDELRRVVLTLVSHAKRLRNARRHRESVRLSFEDPYRPQLVEGEYRERAELLERAESEIAEQRSALDAARISAGAAHPAIWKMWDDRLIDPEDLPADPSEFANWVLSALRTTYGANLELAARIKRQPERVWEFPLLVTLALRDDAISEFSIAARAAHERVTAAGVGERAVQQAALTVGLGQLVILGAGWIGLAAPPLVIAAAVAGAVTGVADALREYEQYAREQRAFDACLDPSLALSAEPSLLGTAVVISLNLLSLLPPAPARAAAPVR